ncbi:hypothetical protein PVAND_003197 [Polypedilum vanderplanki]|uniref:Luc7-like protein 3 n=1 Tax=Polypedilum vanderplanki TaxID=319348 RepID=A0A9J6BUD5_POLVA|nr:hypothetical protein PVAND_003197 [Polypedilum vanderplanki]
MVDFIREQLDELMGRDRNLPVDSKVRERSWKDSENCKYFMHSFCPNDLFVNTKSDLGPCGKLHDEEMKKMYEKAPRCNRKIDIENEFIRFINSMIVEVDKKIQKGKQRLDLMNSKLDQRPLSKQAEQIATINDKINKLLKEAEDCGIRGDVDQAQNLMGLCEKLKDDKEQLIKQFESCGFNYSEQKEMEVCGICGAFLVIGDAQSRIDDHLMDKQHLGYSKLRKALEDHKKNVEKEIGERRSSAGSSSSNSRRDRDRYRDDDHRRDRDRDRYRDRDRRDRDRREDRYKERDRRSRSRDRHRRDRRSRS